MNFAEISCENVRALLQARGWSLRRLAQQTGLSASTLSEALRSRHGLSVDALCHVAQAMGVTVEALCSRPSTPGSPNASPDRRRPRPPTPCLMRTAGPWWTRCWPWSSTGCASDLHLQQDGQNWPSCCHFLY